jgi:hypothetical protein
MDESRLRDKVKYYSMIFQIKLLPACLCRIGREIGFTDDDLTRFSRLSMINWHSTHYLESTLYDGPDYHFEIPRSVITTFLELKLN